MSHASVKPRTSTPQSSLEELMGFGVKLLLLSLENFRTVLQQAPTFPVPDLNALRPKDPCAIPETECPPRCVCDVTWESSPGETPSLTLRVTNSSATARTFQLQATPFTGPGGSPGTLSLSPATLNSTSERLMSGGSTSIFIRRQSSMCSAIRSVLSISQESRAAMNSCG